MARASEGTTSTHMSVRSLAFPMLSSTRVRPGAAPSEWVQDFRATRTMACGPSVMPRNLSEVGISISAL